MGPRGCGPLAAVVGLLLAAGQVASHGSEPGDAAGPRAESATAVSQESPPPADPQQEEPSFWERLHDEEDGAFDIGNFLGSGKGFLPVALPISEPAVGVGLIGAIAYFHSPDSEVPDDGSFVQPSISFLGGAGTDNGTRAGTVGHLGVWKAGRIRYTGVVLGADVNLEFFEQGAEQGEGLDWNIRLSGTYHQIKMAVRESLFLGARYYFFSTESVLGDPRDEGVEDSDLVSDLAGLGVTATWDSRNTTFSPTKGLFADLTWTVHDELLGSDFNYSRVDLTAFKYWDLDRVVLGLRAEGGAVGSGGPFYGLPYLRMRGVPAFRHVGRYSALAEIEPMLRVTNRWGWIGFVAAGQSVSSSSDFGDSETVVAGGTGFRYLLARKLGLSVGIDVASGGEDTAVYFVNGSYWGGR